TRTGGPFGWNERWPAVRRPTRTGRRRPSSRDRPDGALEHHRALLTKKRPIGRREALPMNMNSVLATGGAHPAAQLHTYVLVPPARNEEAFIERTIQSVIGQTIRPLRWVIVSDGSPDRTDEIAQRHL